MYLAKAVRELVQYDVPAVGKFGAKILVQCVHLPVDDGVLILLHYAGECGFSRDEVGQFAMRPAPTITRPLQRLSSTYRREVIQLENDNYRLTDLESKRVREQLSDSLVLDGDDAKATK